MMSSSAGPSATDQAIDKHRFDAVARELPDSLLRAKAILRLRVDGREQRAVFHLVGKRQTLSVEPGPLPTLSQFVVIARADRLDVAGLEQQMQALQA